MLKKLIKNIFLIFILLFFLMALSHASNNYKFISPFERNTLQSLALIENQKQKNEVFGFAPYWNINKLDNIDFNVLTTLAYFDLPVDGQGNIDTEGPGYQTFVGDKATEIFKKAHKNGTRVVITFTQMNNYDINSLVENKEAQKNFIDNAVNLVSRRGVDGLNIDFEYTGDPGNEYRAKFTEFVKGVTTAMHKKVPGSKVTVSVYASSAIDPKIYNIAALAKETDGIFMMAYDYAVATSDNAIPTSPLYGYKEGKYWYDVSTAVEDFLKVMSPNKLILGLPWYGYNYPVYSPEVKAEIRQGYYSYYWVGRRQYRYYVPSFSARAQTYSDVHNIQANLSGWDNEGKVGWKAYQEGGVWRMIFIEDPKSLKIKYDFAKQKNLAGVGIWAMGNDEGRPELWNVLTKEFGIKLVDNIVSNKKINEII